MTPSPSAARNMPWANATLALAAVVPGLPVFGSKATVSWEVEHQMARGGTLKRLCLLVVGLALLATAASPALAEIFCYRDAIVHASEVDANATVAQSLRADGDTGGTMPSGHRWSCHVHHNSHIGGFTGSGSCDCPSHVAAGSKIIIGDDASSPTAFVEGPLRPPQSSVPALT
jgi:hypothetical protein